MSEQKRERGDRVKVGTVTRRTTQAGNEWFIGNLGPDTKIVLLPARRKSEDGEWENVENKFDIYFEAKTTEEKQRDKEYWESRRGNASNSKPAPSGRLADAPAANKGPGRSSLHDGGMPADEIPF